MLNKIIKEKKRFQKKISNYFVKKNYYNKNKSQRIILFFFPTDYNSISGGLLSITTIQNEIRTLEYIHSCKVYCSFLPGVKNSFYRYATFENNLTIYNFDEITKYFKKLDFLELQIPEIFIDFFTIENKDFNTFFNWIPNIKKIKINILNQNETLMPKLTSLSNLAAISNNITMTVAHKRYATAERRDFYGLPLHLLTPWISSSPYIVKKFVDKKNIVVVSPDQIDEILYKTSIKKQDVIDFLIANLPEFEIIIIQNFKYEDYKKLIGNAKFALTFGEGLDGYFAEPVLSGSISFAVYNEVFFLENFKTLKTVYENFDALLQNIILDIKFLNCQKEYDNYNIEQLKLINNLYGIHIFKSDIKNYYLGNYNFK